jgi:peptidoglycan-associated lipoprotein
MTPSMGGDVFPGDIPGADIGGGTGWQDSSQPLDTGVGVGQEPVRWTGAVVYFGYDSAAVGPSEMPKIEQVASHMLSHPNYRVIIEGHCDERGSDEYNRALGQQRAFVVRDLLLSKGIEEGRIETVSYGEEKPVVPNATDEAGHQKNRRAEFLFALMK